MSSAWRSSHVILCPKPFDTVIEPQHGFISSTHPAYYYGESVLRSESLTSFFPDYFLSYGPFWTNSIRIPGESVPIGNPHLSESIKTHEVERSSPSPNNILVASSGTTVRETKELLVSLIKRLGDGYKILLRPHPLEKKAVYERYKEAIDAGVVIDANENIYDSIASSALVIAETSTVLFESLALLKPTKLFNSSYSKEYLTDELKHISVLDINSGKLAESEFDPREAADYYWIADWKVAFHNFVSERLT